MKFITILLLSSILLFSCDCEDTESSIFEGDYVLSSYSSDDCNTKIHDFWISFLDDKHRDDLKKNELLLTGNLAINSGNTFEKTLTSESKSDTKAPISNSFTGILVNEEFNENWTAECCVEPFDASSCFEISLVDDLLTWTFTSANDCNQKLVWEKNINNTKEGR